LSRRDPKLPAPIQMGDALTRNVPKAREVIPSNCLAHGLRKIAAELDDSPEECRSLLTRLSQVYDVDERCKKEKVSDEERARAAAEVSRAHRAIAAAVLSGDRTLARRRLRRHLEVVSAYLR